MIVGSIIIFVCIVLLHFGHLEEVRCWSLFAACVGIDRCHLLVAFSVKKKEESTDKVLFVFCLAIFYYFFLYTFSVNF